MSNVYYGCLACLVTGLVSAVAAAQCRYEVTIIEADDCNGRVITSGLAINERGDVAGRSTCRGGASRPFLWTPEDGFIRIPFPPGENWITCLGINDARQIVMQGELVGYVWEDGEFTELPPAACTGVIPLAINSHGRVVGQRENVDCDNNAFIWSEEDGFLDLGVMNGPQSFARDINDSGTAVGMTGDSDTRQAFIWSNGKLTLLNLIPESQNNWATSINASGVITGVAKIDGVSHPVLRRNGKSTLLPLIPGYVSGITSDNNDVGQVVGHCSRGNTRAAIWQHGEVIPLNTLIDEAGFDIRFSEAINNRGQIITRGNGPDLTTAFLLTPLDQPLGDLDNDCRVGGHDVQILLSAWGPGGHRADLDEDGQVGFGDLVILLGNWG